MHVYVNIPSTLNGHANFPSGASQFKCLANLSYGYASIPTGVFRSNRSFEIETLLMCLAVMPAHGRYCRVNTSSAVSRSKLDELTSSKPLYSNST